MRYTLPLIILLACLIAACTPTVTSYRVNPGGSVIRLGTVISLIPIAVVPAKAGSMAENLAPRWRGNDGATQT